MPQSQNLEALAKSPVRCYTFLKNREVFIMQFFTDSNMQFPLVELSLNQGETVFIQRGSMVYHTPNVTLSTNCLLYTSDAADE